MVRGIFFAFVAALGCATAANAGVVVISPGSGANFDAFNNDPVGSTFGTTTTAFGLVTWTTTPGDAPQISQVTDISVANRDLAPNGDATNFIFAQQGGSATLNFVSELTSVTIYWGSPDTYNTVTLSNGDVITGTEVASALHFAANGSNANSMWVTITDTTQFNAFTATSGSPAFEFDLAGAVTTIPEPSSWAMLMLGFSGLGYAAFRRNAKTRTIVKSI